MNKHLIHGLIVGALFAVIITWVAALDAVEVGGLALLASVVFGLAVGLCIGVLITANFAMLAAEKLRPYGSISRISASASIAAKRVLGSSILVSVSLVSRRLTDSSDGGIANRLKSFSVVAANFSRS